MFETLHMYFQYPFVRYALIVGVLIALCSSSGRDTGIEEIFFHR